MGMARGAKGKHSLHPPGAVVNRLQIEVAPGSSAQASNHHSNPLLRGRAQPHIQRCEGAHVPKDDAWKQAHLAMLAKLGKRA
jgi:hypothetical protein